MNSVWRFAHLLSAILLSGSLTACAESSDYFQQLETLKPLHKKITPPNPGDWLAQHKEPGQTFRQYIRGNPIRPDKKRHTLYIQLLGDFSKEQQQVVNKSAEFMGLYYNVPVKFTKTIPLSKIPESARRVHPSWGMKQILSTYVLDDVLKPRLPKDAAAYIAFTATDLWPGRGWNFVFGQASLRERVGVWSIYRNGDPTKDEAAFRLCLLRTMKTAVHETGHMFSIKHCTLYECCMCGSNHQEESDRRPIWLCPECVTKVHWATGADPVTRYGKLADFCAGNGLKTEADFYRRSQKKISTKD
ncbi:MAG: archaemetzincin [Verrucomicrobiota bacterium]